MPAISDTKKISFELRWFLSALGACLVVIFGGFWALYSFNVSALTNHYDQQIGRETKRMNDSAVQAKTNNDALLDSIRRENSVKIEALEAENRSKLREANLANQAAITKVETQARHEKENLTQTLDTLRQKLSVSRSSLEISAAGDFISIAALLIDGRRGNELMADGGFANEKRLLLPDYTALGWQKFEGIAIAQVDGYISEQTIKLKPDDANENQIDWQPLLTVWAKDSKNSVGIVGAAQLSKKEYAEFLQRSSKISTKTTIKNKDGTTSEKTETTTIDAQALIKIPIGISAYTFISSLIFQNDALSASNLKISSFSARTDGLHFAATYDDPSTGKKLESELLVMEDNDDIFLFLDISSAVNALDPISTETVDWLRRVRIIKKP